MAKSGGESKSVVLAALAGNLAIAVVKFTAFGFTRSTAMLTEAIHSLVDTIDQALLLVGEARGRKPADATHPFGYGLEIYFWSFTVALMVFVLGGTVSIYEGVLKLRYGGEVQAPWISYPVLGVSFLFEGASFAVSWRAYRKVVAGRRVGVIGFIRRSKDPNLYTTLLEDGAALIGLVLAALGTFGAAQLKLPWADGAASVAIGVLLVAVAATLANETRSLIADEAADPDVKRKLDDAAASAACASQVTEIATLHLGPNAILVCVTLQELEPGAGATAELTERLQAVDDRVARIYFRPVPTQGGVAPEPSAAA
ncbi:cation diffusion facilitator family transporter [soil metagenome]